MKSTAPKIHICGGGACASTKMRTVGWSTQILGRGLALGPVVAHARLCGFEFGEGVAGDDPVEFGMAEGADGHLARLDEQLGADLWSVDHRRQRNGLLSAQQRGVALEQGGAGGAPGVPCPVPSADDSLTSRALRCTGGSCRHR